MESDLLGKRGRAAEVLRDDRNLRTPSRRLSEASSESDSEDKSELLLRHSLKIERSCKGPRREPLPRKRKKAGR